VNRRNFLRLGAGVPVLGSLLLSKATVLDGSIPPTVASGEATPSLYVPEQPTIIAATNIRRPVMEGGIFITDWSMDVEHDYQNIASIHDPARHYVALEKPRISVRMRGEATDVQWFGDRYSSGKRLRMYLVEEEG
jgi:hypothetical protein